MAYERQEAIDAVTRFNEYFDTLSVEKQNDYYGGKGSSLEKDYLYCMQCRGSDFRPTKPGDCPDGCTLSPVIYEEKSNEDS